MPRPYFLTHDNSAERLPKLFDEMGVPRAVIRELEEGQRKGYDVPKPSNYTWLRVVDPRAIPSEAMALGLEHPSRIVLLDEGRAREIAEAADLQVWGTLKSLLEAQARGLPQKLNRSSRAWRKQVCGFPTTFDKEFWRWLAKRGNVICAQTSFVYSLSIR